MTVNPLVAPAIDQPTDMWAGIWIAEDIELIVQGVKTNSWVDTALGSIGAALDGLAFVSDPGGAVLQYFASWAMEHFKPLTDVLDWLAGDPGAIAGHAQTWRNVSTALHGEVTQLTNALNADVGTWGGTAGPTYRAWAQLQHCAVDGLANGCEAMATITERAGYVVGAVRIMVRDLIAIAFSRTVSYLVELGFSVGFAAPLVVEQVTTLALSTGSRIARLLRGLIDSLRRLFENVPRLLSHIDELKQILNRLHRADPVLPKKIPGPGQFNHLDVDPLRVHGPARTTHPAEWDAAIEEAKALGVEVLYRENAMAYAPGVAPGRPGQLILDPDSSYGALLHEMSHLHDDLAAGWPGFSGWFDSVDKVCANETRAYQKEIDYATSIGDLDAAARLVEIRDAAIAKIQQEW